MEIPDIRPTGTHKILPVEILRKGECIAESGTIFISYDDVYKLCFVNNDVSDEKVQQAIRFARRRIFDRIDSIK